MKYIVLVIFQLLVINGLHGQTVNSNLPDSVIQRQAEIYSQHSGTAAPLFSLIDTSGHKVRFTDFKGKIVVIDLWFTSCGPCLSNFPHYEKVQDFFGDSTNIEFVSICIDEITKKLHWKNLIKEKELKGTHLFLPKDDTAKFNLFYRDTDTFPTYLLIGNNGEILGTLPDPDEFVLMAYAIHRGVDDVYTKDSFIELINNSDQTEEWFRANITELYRLQGE